MLFAVHTFREHRHKNKTLHDGAGTSRHTYTHGIMSSTNIHFSALG